MPGPTAADLQAAVRAALAEQSASGETVTARTVRLAVEKRLGLAVDSLLPRKDELMGFIAEELQQATSTHAAGAVSEAIKALEDPDGGATKAALLVAELEGSSCSSGDCKESQDAQVALALLAEACAASERATSRLLEANIGRALVPLVSPEAPTPTASLAVRLLSAMSTHRCGTDAIVKSPVVGPLLVRLSTAAEGVGVQCAVLVHNLADSPATRMRLIFAGALGVLTRVLLEPVTTPALKEHCLQAVASLAGMPEAELSFPALLGTCLSSKTPGTQRAALNALQLIRERQPEVEGRLAGVDELMAGLASAASSTDAEVSRDAAEALAALQQAD